MIPASSELVFQKINHLFRMEKDKAEALFSPYFVHYHRGFFSETTDFRRQVEYFYNVFRIAKAEKARVLDIGSGFGLMSIFFAVFGSAEVFGVDANEEKIAGFRSLIKWAGLKNSPIRAEFGDALSLNYPDEEFEVIIANDVLSHVRDLDGFLKEAGRLLKPMGRFYVYDNNNKLFLPNIFRYRKLWNKLEKGPTDTIAFRGTDEQLSFEEMRKRMILELEPECDPVHLEYLVKKTAGMYGEEIQSSVLEFGQRGKIKNQKSFKYRNPKTGEFPEKPINPFLVSKALRSKGFFCQALPTFFSVKPSGFKGIMKKELGLIFKLIPTLSFVMAPSFRILGLKRKP